MRSFLFPGQGSQKIGMGKDLYENFASAKEVFQEVDEALNQNLSTLIFSGNQEDLNLTKNTQPALMAVSLAVIKVLEKDFNFDISKNVSFVAGHSLGEYSALCAAKAISISETAKLLQLRGQAMLDASPVGKGGMAAVLGSDANSIENIIKEVKEEQEICVIANDNSNSQLVISGNKEAVERFIEKGKELKIRALPLPVSGAFHSPLMQPAADAMEQHILSANIQSPIVPLFCNVTAQSETDPEKIKSLLLQQITHSVKWRETIDNIVNSNITEVVEVGSGAVLTGMIKRDYPNVNRYNLMQPSEIEGFIESLSK